MLRNNHLHSGHALLLRQKFFSSSGRICGKSHVSTLTRKRPFPPTTAGVCALYFCPSGVSLLPPPSAPGERRPPTATWRFTTSSHTTPSSPQPAPSHAISLAGSIHPPQNAALTAPRISPPRTPTILPHRLLKDMPKITHHLSRGSYANQKPSHPILHIDPAKKNCWRPRMGGGSV